MARHYNTKKFFRQSPKGLLARYFKRHRVLRDFDFAKLKEGNPDPLFVVWLELPAEKRNRMNTKDRRFNRTTADMAVTGTATR